VAHAFERVVRAVAELAARAGVLGRWVGRGCVNRAIKSRCNLVIMTGRGIEERRSSPGV
jgi:hypothetical protein